MLFLSHIVARDLLEPSVTSMTGNKMLLTEGLMPGQKYEDDETQQKRRKQVVYVALGFAGFALLVMMAGTYACARAVTD